MRRIATLLVVALAAGYPMAAPPAVADDHTPVVLTDVYIEMDDGIRLAADIHLPPGTPADGSEQVPCLVELSPYRKELRASEGASLLPFEGFGLIEVDARGTGGSEGEYDIVFSLREQYDTAHVIDWAATESGLCTKKVGMFGGSYSGIIQYLVATLPPDRAPAHLAAIAPQRAYGDLYRDIVYHGGQIIGSFGATWTAATTALYTAPPTNIDTEQGQRAWLDHLTENDPMLLPYLTNPYADAVFTWTNDTGPHSQLLYEDSSALGRIDRLTVPTLHLAGWFDTFTRGQALTFQRALEAERSLGDRGPNYLIMGPWNHGDTHFIRPPNFTDRLVDWYRHWLDGGDRPAWMDGPRATYCLMDSAVPNTPCPEWRTTDTWPPSDAELTRLHLRADGRLTAEEPGAEGSSSYVYNPAAGTAEVASRWDNAALVPQVTWDQRTDEPKGLSFETDAFGENVAAAGPIALRLWAATHGAPGRTDLASSWPGAAQLTPPYHDTDFVVKLSDVAPDGTSTLVTQGYLRASHRTLDLGRSVVVDGEIVSPYHHHTLAALDPPVPGEAREYHLEIWPTAKVFPAGHKLRVTIYSADTPNHLNLLKPALNEVFHTTSMASYLTLPMVAADAD